MAVDLVLHRKTLILHEQGVLLSQICFRLEMCKLLLVHCEYFPQLLKSCFLYASQCVAVLAIFVHGFQFILQYNKFRYAVSHL